MSNGGSIPYHLRPNKSVERGLFIQALRRINEFKNISDYRYIGFGGPFLEDFKVLHQELKIRDMLCIEVNNNVRARQEFNKPLSCIKFLDEVCTGEEFVSNYDFDKETIIWLDFVSFNDLTGQLQCLHELLTKLSSGDIFKVTFNANSSNLGKPKDETELQKYRLEKFRNYVTDDYFPQEVDERDMVAGKFPQALLKSAEIAISKGIETACDLEVLPISAFVYEDGQKMLTITGVVLQSNEIDEFIDTTRLEHWHFFSKDWGFAENISLPILSARERLLIEQMLPDSNVDDIRKELGFYVAQKESLSEQQLKNFINYYRSMPWFGKFAL